MYGWPCRWDGGRGGPCCHRCFARNTPTSRLPCPARCSRNPHTSDRRAAQTSHGTYNKYREPLFHFGCKSTKNVGMQPRLFTALRPKLTQAGPRDDRVQSWPHPRVGLDSQRLKGSGPAGCGSDELTDPALLHFDQCARKRPPIEKGSGQVICNSPGHGFVGDADGVGDGSAYGRSPRRRLPRPMLSPEPASNTAAEALAVRS